MGGIYRLAVAVIVMIFLAQTSSKKLKSPGVSKSRSLVTSQHILSQKLTNQKECTSILSLGIIPSLATLATPLLANAAAGIPVGISSVKQVRGIPMDISTMDTVEKWTNTASAGALLPDTSINALDGAINLGAILFTFVLYNGLFGKAGRPADWVLPVVAKALGEEESSWFKDYTDGFSFAVPPTVEFLRFGFFGVLGWYTNLAWIAALDGDSFWGWSTAACLCFPSGLIALSRDAKPSREENQFEVKMKENFAMFASKVLSKEKNSKTSEANIILRFRRSFTAYRTEEDVSDKDLKKVIRQWIGFKTNAEGYYMDVSLLNRKRQSRQALAQVMSRLDEEKASLLQQQTEEDDDDEDYPRFDNEFIRK